MTAKHETDIVIIGAGPVGLFTIFEAGMLKMRCHVVDTLDFIGGQCTALYPEKPIYDIPAHPVVTANELIELLHTQSMSFKPEFHLGQQVTELIKTSEGFIVTTDKGNSISCKAVIIACGAGAFGPNRPPLENIEEYENKSLFYMVKSKKEFSGKNIVIAGGGDSAADWAVSLSEITNKLYLLHRRNKFRCAPGTMHQIEELVAKGKIDIIAPYQLHAINGQNGMITEVVVKDLDNSELSLKADCLLAFYGLAMQLGPILNWGLNIDYNHIVVDPSTCSTNIEGVFAIGDIASYKGKLKLILTGFSEAAIACHNAYKHVYPGQALHFEYSTTKGIA